MWNASIDHVEDLIMSTLLVKFLDNATRDINNLNDCFVLMMTRFYFEVAFLSWLVAMFDQFKYHFVSVSLHYFA